MIRQAIHRFAEAPYQEQARGDIDTWVTWTRASAKRIGRGDAMAEIRRWRDAE